MQEEALVPNNAKKRRVSRYRAEFPVHFQILLLCPETSPMGLVSRSLRFDASRGSTVDFDRGPEKAPLGAGLSLSDEESRIRGELELDVERDLEEEIKDGMYRLALQLHQLYRHQKERIARAPQSAQSTAKNRRRIEEKSVSEVNISIKMEGGTKVVIRETKREGTRDKTRPRTAPATPKSNCPNNNEKRGTIVRRGKKFDWANSLRSGGGAGAVDEKGSRNVLGKSRMHPRGRHVSRSSLRSEGCRMNVDGDSARHKVNRRVDHKLLDMEMGWKS